MTSGTEGDCSLQRRGEGSASHVTVEQPCEEHSYCFMYDTLSKSTWALAIHVAARGGCALTRVNRLGKYSSHTPIHYITYWLSP